MSVREKIRNRLVELQRLVEEGGGVSDIRKKCLSIKKFYSVLGEGDREYVDSVYRFYDGDNE